MRKTHLIAFVNAATLNILGITYPEYQHPGNIYTSEKIYPVKSETEVSEYGKYLIASGRHRRNKLKNKILTK